MDDGEAASSAREANRAAVIRDVTEKANKLTPTRAQSYPCQSAGDPELAELVVSHENLKGRTRSGDVSSSSSLALTSALDFRCC